MLDDPTTVHATLDDPPTSDDPCDWEPLYRGLAPTRLADQFSWFGTMTIEDGRTLHVYRNVLTRRFLHVTDEGEPFVYVGGETDDGYRFQREDPSEVVAHVLLPQGLPSAGFEDAGSPVLDDMFARLCEICDDAGLARPERNVVIDLQTGEPVDAAIPPHEPARAPTASRSSPTPRPGSATVRPQPCDPRPA